MSTNEARVAPSAASSGATDGSSRPRTHSARSLICIAQASAMLIPAIFDERASALSRVPPHSGQAVIVETGPLLPPLPAPRPSNPPRPADRSHIEGEPPPRPDMRFSEPAEQNP